MLNRLYGVLMGEDIIQSINNNLGEVLDLIPEIKDMIGFSHNHPHHYLDVWEHTLAALSYAPMDFDIRLVLLLHDIGKPHSFQEGEVRHFKGHPLVSSNIARGIFSRFGFSCEEIDRLCYLILKHDEVISDGDIKSDLELSKVRFIVQCCDTFAHNPTKIGKRLEYLLDANERINSGQVKCEYEKMILSFRK